LLINTAITKQVSNIKKTTIGKPEKWLIDVSSSINIDFSPLVHEITEDFVEHTMKRHGDYNTHGTATISGKDFDYIGNILKTPDYVIIGAIRNNTMLNAYAKINDRVTWIYFEEVLISRKNKSLRGKTLYKITRPLLIDEFVKNVTRNNKTDISKAVVLSLQENVQTAGGNPGG
jgi:hypothetical protein